MKNTKIISSYIIIKIKFLQLNVSEDLTIKPFHDPFLYKCNLAAFVGDRSLDKSSVITYTKYSVSCIKLHYPVS